MESTSERRPESEPSSATLVNPSRVLPAQEKHIRLLEGSRYVPVKHKYTSRPILSGFVLLRDLQPSEAEVLALTDAPSTVASTAGAGSAAAQQGSTSAAAMAVDDEPQPPQPFEYSS